MELLVKRGRKENQGREYASLNWFTQIGQKWKNPEIDNSVGQGRGNNHQNSHKSRQGNYSGVKACMKLYSNLDKLSNCKCEFLQFEKIFSWI